MKKMSIACFVIPSILSLSPLCAEALENNGGYTIRDVTVRQRWPWDRKVDIDFYLARPDGAPADKLVNIGVFATNAGSPVAISDAALNRKYFSADGACRIVWDPLVDHKDESFNSLVVTLCVAETNLAPTYMTVNLHSGKLAYYPASFSNSVNADLYKTTYMAFRRCPATTSSEWLALSGGNNYFTAGSPTNEPGRLSSPFNETQTNVILTQDFYLGVFEVTQCQYTNITMGSNPAIYTSADRIIHPIENVTYETLRGVDVTYRWPTTTEVDPSSFMGILRTRTGKSFDLPTEQQWEYACRAGTTDVRYFTWSEMAKYVQHSKGITFAVGQVLPNPWGFYNMYENVAEMVLSLGRDHDYSEFDSTSLLLPISGGTNPTGPAPTVEHPWRCVRGTHTWGGGESQYVRSAYRQASTVNFICETLTPKTITRQLTGFRVGLTVY